MKESSRSLSVATSRTIEASTFAFPAWVNLRAKLFAASLDAKLAKGVDPTQGSVLAARATQLATKSIRHNLSDAWVDILVEARTPRASLGARVPIVRRRVLMAEATIHALIDAIDGPLPTVQGLAMAITILRDGAGPLFNPDPALSLSESLEAALAQMSPFAVATH